MTHIKEKACCASCIAYREGCCTLTDTPRDEEESCMDFFYERADHFIIEGYYD